jgi:hypothetical protein
VVNKAAAANVAKAKTEGSGTELRKTGELPKPASLAGGVGPAPVGRFPVITLNRGDCHHESGKPDALAWEKETPEAVFQTSI